MLPSLCPLTSRITSNDIRFINNYILHTMPKNLKKSKIKVRKKMPKPTVIHKDFRKMCLIDNIKHSLKMLNKRLRGNGDIDLD